METSEICFLAHSFSNLQFSLRSVGAELGACAEMQRIFTRGDFIKRRDSQWVANNVFWGMFYIPIHHYAVVCFLAYLWALFCYQSALKIDLAQFTGSPFFTMLLTICLMKPNNSRAFAPIATEHCYCARKFTRHVIHRARVLAIK